MSWFKTTEEKRLLTLVAEKKSLEHKIQGLTNARLALREEALQAHRDYEDVAKTLKDEFKYIR